MTSLMRSGGPVTLTRGQFGKTAAGQKPGANYEGYLGYIARRRAAKLSAPPAAADPLAPTSTPDIFSTVNKVYGQPQNDTQIQSTAAGMLDPVVAALTANINSRAKQSSSAIAANSAGLAGELGKIDFAAPYRGAESGQAAVDAALREGLAGDGGALANDLKTRLAAINDPSVAAAGDSLAATGTASGNAELTRGSASLSDLLAEAAAAKSFGLKQPGIARLAGLQDIANTQKQATDNLSSQTAQIESQLPSVVQALRGERSNLVGNRASLLATLLGQNITKATAKAGLENTNFDNGLNYANTFGVDPVSGQPVKGYHVDGSGNVVKDPTARAPKPLSTTDRARIAKAAQDLRYGVQPKQQYNTKTQAWMDVPGTGTPNSSYQEAYQSLIALGATPDYAHTLVNGLYKPGEYGRPLSAAQKKTNAAVKSGLGVPKLEGPLAGLGG